MELVKIIGDKLATPVTVLSGIVHKGAYDAGTDYAVGDVVSYNGASYVMYTDAGAGTAPTDTTKWQVLSSPQQYVESIGELALVNATTDNTISIDQNGNVGTDVATDGAIHIENTGNTGIGLGVYTNIGATADAPLVSIKADNVAFDQTVVKISNDASYHGLHLYQQGILVADQHALFVESVSNQTASPLVKFKSDASGSDQNVLRIDNDGTGAGVNIVQNGNGDSLAITVGSTDRYGIFLYCNSVHTTRALQHLQQNNTSGTSEVLKIVNNGTGQGLLIDNNGTGTANAIEIDMDGNNAAKIFGIKITVDNAGVGGVGGIDFSGMGDGEALFKLTSTDTDLSTKSPETDAESGWFPVDVGGTIYAVPMYALS